MDIKSEKMFSIFSKILFALYLIFLVIKMRFFVLRAYYVVRLPRLLRSGALVKNAWGTKW